MGGGIYAVFCAVNMLINMATIFRSKVTMVAGPIDYVIAAVLLYSLLLKSKEGKNQIYVHYTLLSNSFFF